MNPPVTFAEHIPGAGRYVPRFAVLPLRPGAVAAAGPGRPRGESAV